MTTTLIHRSSRADDNAVRIARVAAAGRVQAARIRAEHVRKQQEAEARFGAERCIEWMREEGATQVGFKICDEMGKWRQVLPIDDAAWLIASTWGKDAEVWGMDAQGQHTGGVW